MENALDKKTGGRRFLMLHPLHSFSLIYYVVGTYPFPNAITGLEFRFVPPPTHTSTFLRPQQLDRNSGLFQNLFLRPLCAESNSWEVLGFIVL